jgi:hypothetical protein
VSYKLERKWKKAVEVKFEEVPRNMPGWLQEKNKHPSLGHPVSGRDFNTGPSECEAGALPSTGPRNLVCHLIK